MFYVSTTRFPDFQCLAAKGGSAKPGKTVYFREDGIVTTRRRSRRGRRRKAGVLLSKLPTTDHAFDYLVVRYIP